MRQTLRSCKKPDGGDSAHRPLCTQWGMQEAAHPPNVALLMEGSELASPGTRELAEGYAEQRTRLPFPRGVLSAPPRGFSGVRRNEGSKDPAVDVEGCGCNSKKRLTEGQHGG